MNKNIVWHNATVTRSRREKLNKHKSFVLWFTGLSGSGKSTLAHSIEEELHQMGQRTFVFDGDNVRQGLCADLTFSKADRKENIRRIAHMSKLFVEAGIIAITAFISPFKVERENARKIIGGIDFIEVYCKCSLQVCEQRDVKGLYAKARKGDIKNYTGISSPYEESENADIIIDTAKLNIDEAKDIVINYLTKGAE